MLPQIRVFSPCWWLNSKDWSTSFASRSPRFDPWHCLVHNFFPLYRCQVFLNTLFVLSDLGSVCCGSVCSTGGSHWNMVYLTQIATPASTIKTQSSLSCLRFLFLHFFIITAQISSLVGNLTLTPPQVSSIVVINTLCRCWFPYASLLI